MSEESITYLLLSLLACVASFCFGYFLCKYRETRLANNPGVCDKLTDTIEGSKERTDQLEDRLGGIIEAGNDIEEILRKYSDSTPDSKDLE